MNHLINVFPNERMYAYVSKGGEKVKSTQSIIREETKHYDICFFKDHDTVCWNKCKKKREGVEQSNHHATDRVENSTR